MANVEALEQLKRVVRDAPDKLFNMNTLGDKTDCGTARCAIGHAYHDRWFQEHTSLHMCVLDHEGTLFNACWDDLASVFGIQESDSSSLFAIDYVSGCIRSEIPKSDVIANIDRLIRGEPVLPYLPIGAAS